MLIASEMRDDDVVFTGLVTGDRTALFAAGIPLAAAVLAQKTHAPNLTVLLAGWIVNPDLREMRRPPVSEFDPELLTLPCDARGQRFPGVMNAQRGDVTLGFSSAAQIDRTGALNTHRINLPGGGFRALVGPILIPEHMTLFGREIVMMPRHDKRNFVGQVDYRCGPPLPRQRAGAAEYGYGGAGPSLVVTPRCVLDFDQEGLMKLRSVHATSSIDDVLAHTGFDLRVDSSVPTTPRPDQEYLDVLRTEVDPFGVMLGTQDRGSR
ncbi:hypothetical protein FHP29_14605 [Nocardioides albidus]|uniref:CoA-transferase n=1 Tax=Nocardioides albidus TaxID=1517589 RepID=A0A5C4VRF6_9ACTN|nr:hypothetical protein [Nocardioides albidus]TNM38473.1 hypothetical protein FHP29_14605 [Nocardioides albidus]